MKIGVGIFAALVLSGCAEAPVASQTPKLVGPETYLLWSGKPGWAEDHLGRLGQAIARAGDFCGGLNKTPQIRTETSTTEERATFICVAEAS